MHGRPLSTRSGAVRGDTRLIRVFDTAREGVAVPMISRRARLVAWPGAGAQQAQMNYVILEPHESNVPHRLVRSEDSIFVV